MKKIAIFSIVFYAHLNYGVVENQKIGGGTQSISKPTPIKSEQLQKTAVHTQSSESKNNKDIKEKNTAALAVLFYDTPCGSSRII